MPHAARASCVNVSDTGRSKPANLTSPVRLACWWQITDLWSPLVSRSSLLNHMAREHSFSVGLPDNIVYCKQFLETLQSKLDRSVSLARRDREPMSDLMV